VLARRRFCSQALGDVRARFNLRNGKCAAPAGQCRSPIRGWRSPGPRRTQLQGNVLGGLRGQWRRIWWRGIVVTTEAALAPTKQARHLLGSSRERKSSALSHPDNWRVHPGESRPRDDQAGHDGQHAVVRFLVSARTRLVWTGFGWFGPFLSGLVSSADF
jgi:hypothetical protein